MKFGPMIDLIERKTILKKKIQKFPDVSILWQKFEFFQFMLTSAIFEEIINFFPMRLNEFYYWSKFHEVMTISS